MLLEEEHDINIGVRSGTRTSSVPLQQICDAQDAKQFAAERAGLLEQYV